MTPAEPAHTHGPVIEAPVAIVTGSGRRLGRRIALALGAAGFAVVANYNSSRKGAEQVVKTVSRKGGRAVAVRADVSKRGEVQGMMREAFDTFGRIDLLVNNSAIFVEAPFGSITDEIWDRTLDINLKGVLLCSQAVTPFMLKRKSGKIINIASLGGLQAWSRHIPYSVSKAGVIMLTRCMAKSLAPHITVNAVAPGTILLKGEENGSLSYLPASKIPLRKFGEPDDVTSLILYLATNASYITGQIIAVDGGRSIP